MKSENKFILLHAKDGGEILMRPEDLKSAAMDKDGAVCIWQLAPKGMQQSNMRSQPVVETPAQIMKMIGD